MNVNCRKVCIARVKVRFAGRKVNLTSSKVMLPGFQVCNASPPVRLASFKVECANRKVRVASREVTAASSDVTNADEEVESASLKNELPGRVRGEISGRDLDGAARFTRNRLREWCEAPVLIPSVRDSDEDKVAALFCAKYGGRTLRNTGNISAFT